MNHCILCNKDLNNGQPINREHYICQTLIRNFDKLQIPAAYTHALRVNLDETNGEAFLGPKSAHKTWATVWVHRKCNELESKVCRTFKAIIDHPNQTITAEQAFDIQKYYSLIWKCDYKDISVASLSNDQVRKMLAGKDYMLMYGPGAVWVGKLVVLLNTPAAKGYEEHTIYFGKEKALKTLIKR